LLPTATFLCFCYQYCSRLQAGRPPGAFAYLALTSFYTTSCLRRRCLSAAAYLPAWRRDRAVSLSSVPLLCVRLFALHTCVPSTMFSTTCINTSGLPGLAPGLIYLYIRQPVLSTWRYTSAVPSPASAFSLLRISTAFLVRALLPSALILCAALPYLLAPSPVRSCAVEPVLARRTFSGGAFCCILLAHYTLPAFRCGRWFPSVHPIHAAPSHAPGFVAWAAAAATASAGRILRGRICACGWVKEDGVAPRRGLPATCALYLVLRKNACATSCSPFPFPSPAQCLDFNTFLLPGAAAAAFRKVRTYALGRMPVLWAAGVGMLPFSGYRTGMDACVRAAGGANAFSR